MELFLAAGAAGALLIACIAIAGRRAGGRAANELFAVRRTSDQELVAFGVEELTHAEARFSKFAARCKRNPEVREAFTRELRRIQDAKAKAVRRARKLSPASSERSV